MVGVKGVQFLDYFLFRHSKLQKQKRGTRLQHPVYLLETVVDGVKVTYPKRGDYGIERIVGERKGRTILFLERDDLLQALGHYFLVSYGHHSFRYIHGHDFFWTKDVVREDR